LIVEKLIDHALHILAGQRIKDVRAGLGYTCVLLDDDTAGLAYTFRNEMGYGCGIINEAGTLIGKTAGEIIPWAKNEHRLKAAIGLATLNAIINNVPGLNWVTGNVADAINISENDTLGMVGEFPPILMNAGKKTQKVFVFELDPPEGSGIYPSESIPHHLPECNVVVLTATSIINHTIDDIIPHCRNAREVCIVGASTPLCPDVFRDYNVTTLAGSIVLNT